MTETETTYGPAYCPACGRNALHRLETTRSENGSVELRLCHCLTCKDAHTG